MSQALKVCVRCGRPGEEGEASRFCLSCGQEHAADPPPSKEFACGHCGSPHDGGFPFCGGCGAALSQQPRAGVPAPEPPKAETSAPQPEPQPAPTPEPVAKPASTLSFELPAGFRYLHSHGALGASAAFAGGGEHVRALLERLRHSDGGTFLVTGYRGVGKTTTVGEALSRYKAVEPGVLPVWLRVAKPIDSIELLYQLVRRLFEVLHDEGVLNRIDAEVARKLVLAYAHASLSLKSSHDGQQSSRHGADLELATRFITKLGLNAPTRPSDAEEAALEVSFLQYAATDVEHDFCRILELLSNAQPQHSGGWFAKKSARQARYRVVIVLDELDKLTASEGGQRAFEQLLYGLKSVLAMQHVHFVFIGGVDLFHTYCRDLVHGDSLYESVFASQHYLPCNLVTGEQLLTSLGATPGKLGESEHQRLLAYLRYASRGISRRLVQELNSLVRFSEGQPPRIEISAANMRKVALYEQLELRLEPFLTHKASAILTSRPHDDARLLGSHYLMDWLLSRNGKLFTVDEAVEFQSGEGVDAHVRLSGLEVGELFEHLVEAEIITQIEKNAAERTQRGDEPSALARVYQLSPWLQEQLFIAGHNVPAAVGSAAAHVAAQNAPFLLPTAPRSYRSRDLDVGAVLADRYELRQLVGQGGMGGVFRAWDRLQGRDVAIKYLLDVNLTDDAKRRLAREADILCRLNSPNIVRCHEVLSDERGTPLIVLDYLEGVTLLQQLSESGGWSVHEAVQLGVALASALEAVDEIGVCRIDLKPGNVMLVGEHNRPVLVDFGIAKAKESADNALTRSGVFIGTPLYMSPEQARGARDIDIRADIWSLGIVLSEVLLGCHPLEEVRDLPLYETLQAVVEADIDLDALHAPLALKQVLRRALRNDPAERYATPAEFREALEQVQPASSSAPATMSGRLDKADPRVSHVSLTAAAERPLNVEEN